MSLVGVLTSNAQQTTNNVVVSFNTLGINPATVYSVTIQGVNGFISGNTVFANYPISISRAQQPGMTNGVVIFSNTVIGVVPYNIYFNGYSTITNCFFVSTNSNAPDASNNVYLQASNYGYVSTYQGVPRFVYTSSIVTNVSSGGSGGSPLAAGNGLLLATNGLTNVLSADTTVLLTNGTANLADGHGFFMGKDLAGIFEIDVPGSADVIQAYPFQNSVQLFSPYFSGNGSNLTALQWANVQGAPTIPSTNGFIPASATVSNAQYAVVSGSASNLLGTISAGQVTGGVVTKQLFSSEDDIYQLSHTFLPPADTMEWMDTTFDGQMIVNNGIWRFQNTNCYVFSEGAGLPGGLSTTCQIPIPDGVTNVTFSCGLSATPDFNGSSVNLGWATTMTGTSEQLQYYIITNQTLTANFSNFSLSYPVTNTITTLGTFAYGSGFTMTNPAITFSPAPTNPVLNVPFSRYQVLNKNVKGGTIHSSYPYPSPFRYAPSGNSAVEFHTDASIVTLEIKAGFSWQYGNSPTPAPLVVMVNGNYQNFYLQAYTNKEFQFISMALPTNQINDVVVYSSHSIYGHVDSLRAVYVPITNSVGFDKRKSDFSLMTIGDSIINSAASTNQFACALTVATRYIGIESYDGGDGSTALAAPLQPIIQSIAATKPTWCWIEHQVNNWGGNTPTNVFYRDLAALVDRGHAASPNTVFILQTATPCNSGIDSSNAINQNLESYRNCVRGVANDPNRTNYCALADLSASGLFNTPTYAGVHPPQSSNVRYGYYIAQFLESNFKYFQPTNTFQFPNLYFTNWIANQYYTNTSGRLWIIDTDEAVTPPALTAGSITGFMLLADPAGGVNWTTNRDGTVTGVASTVAMPVHESMNATIPNGASFVWTNKTTGGSATLVNGHYTQF